MKKLIDLSDLIDVQNDLGDFTLIATRFIDLDDENIFLSYEKGWYTDGLICYNELSSRGFDINVLKDFANRYQVNAVDKDGEIELKSEDPAKLLQTIIAVYFWIDEQNFPIHS